MLQISEALFLPVRVSANPEPSTSRCEAGSMLEKLQLFGVVFIV